MGTQSKLIPTSQKPYWKCKIDNTEYAYLAGTTQTVPDAVAAIIDAEERGKAVAGTPAAEGTVYTANGRNEADFKALPDTPWEDLPWEDMPEAAEETIGGVKMAEAVADATDDTDVVETVNALLDSLRSAGILAPTPEPEPEPETDPETDPEGE